MYPRITCPHWKTLCAKGRPVDQGQNKNCSQTMGWMAPAPDGAKMSPFTVDERERRS